MGLNSGFKGLSTNVKYANSVIIKALSLFSKRLVNSYNLLFSCTLAKDLKLSVIKNMHTNGMWVREIWRIADV